MLDWTQSAAELIKSSILAEGRREKEVERTAWRGRDPRQDAGIPSPSLQSADENGAEGTPLPFPPNTLQLTKGTLERW